MLEQSELSANGVLAPVRNFNNEINTTATKKKRGKKLMLLLFAPSATIILKALLYKLVWFLAISRWKVHLSTISNNVYTLANIITGLHKLLKLH